MKVSIPILTQNIQNLLIKQGHNIIDSHIITKVLLYAELRGNNQGIVKLITNGLSPASDATPIQLEYETPVSAKYNGGQNIGMVVVHECVTTAIRKAKISGISVVGCSGYSSATGALGYWARSIAEQNLIGIVMSQCPEYVAPHGSYEPIFGTNPIAIGLPTKPRCQVLDMATSASAMYGLVTAAAEGRSIPSDIALDSRGNPTTDPKEALKGALLVFDRSFKGSHIALMVELLAGALTGASMEPGKKQARNWGSLVIAIDPAVFGPDSLESFQQSAATMCDRVKGSKRVPVSESDEIYLPGERGDNQESENLAQGVLTMSPVTYNELLKQLNDS